jgi:Polysaccharide lyase
VVPVFKNFTLESRELNVIYCRLIQSLLGILPFAIACIAPACGQTQADPTRLLLSDGFEEGRFSATGGLFYKDNAEQRSGSAVFQSGVVHSGKSALKLSVKPSCYNRNRPSIVARAAVAGPTSATASNCSDRAEVWEKPSVLARYDKSVWYRFALRLDDPVPRDDGRYVLAQWKREIIPGVEHDYSPFLALRLYRGKFGITIETDEVETFPLGTPERSVACKPGEAAVTTQPSYRQTRALVAVEEGAATADYPGAFNACAPSIVVTRHGDLPAATAGWIDLAFRSLPGPRGGGHVEVIANGQPIATIKGRIGHEGPGLGANQYFKFGPYRSEAKTDWSVYYDGFARGPRCRDVIASGYCPDT